MEGRWSLLKKGGGGGDKGRERERSLLKGGRREGRERGVC